SSIEPDEFRRGRSVLDRVANATDRSMSGRGAIIRRLVRRSECADRGCCRRREGPDSRRQGSALRLIGSQLRDGSADGQGSKTDTRLRNKADVLVMRLGLETAQSPRVPLAIAIQFLRSAKAPSSAMPTARPGM